MQHTYYVIGIMSGTSLDGIDIAYCKFDLINDKWAFEIIDATTIAYNKSWQNKLQTAKHMSAAYLAKLDVDYGFLLGKSIKQFINKNKKTVDIIACHGQTIMHQPERNFTVQIGSGAVIAAETGCTLVCDFRTTDVALGGQGAPLVPIGDELLFGDFDACLNIGGFANISFRIGEKRIAYDICPGNAVLNFLANKAGKDFDDGGQLAESGNLSEPLLKQLNGIKYYKAPYPKSLGWEWIDNHIMPVIQQASLPTNDLLRTLTEHIAIQISNNIKAGKAQKILATGGGVRNGFLVERINTLFGTDLIIPSDTIVDYKEALIFAFLGVLRIRNEVNCLSSVTGAVRDSCCGAVYQGAVSPGRF